MKRWSWLFLLAAACGGTASDHERLGDGAYANGDYATALGEYQAAAARNKDEARVWAKLGSAALKTGDLRASADAYLKLAAADKTRISEAARGLELVARSAARDGSDVALQESVDGLRRLGPERVSSRYTLALVRSGKLEPAEAAAMGPLALAAAGDAAATDQMLLQYGQALQATTACSDASEIYQIALRRSRDAGLRSSAIRGMGECCLQLGQEALLVDRPEIANQWFMRVLTVDSTSDRGRRAMVGLGDARMAQGDLLGATIAYQDAMKADTDDSVSALASQRLTRLGATAGTADSK